MVDRSFGRSQIGLLLAAGIAIFVLGMTPVAAASLPPAPFTPTEEGSDPPAGVSLNAPDENETRLPGRWIVILEDSVKSPLAIARAQTRGSGKRFGFVYRHAIKGYSAKLPKAAVEALRKNPKVKYIIPDGKAELTAQTVPSGIERVRAPQNSVADIDGENDAPVDADIAIIDSGVDHEHSDLNVHKRVNCVPPGEGYESEEEFELMECVEGKGTDGYGHGTHVAGTAAAVDNGEGVVGVAPGARLWSVRVFANDGFGVASWVLAATDWVVGQASSIEVANMSLNCTACGFALEAIIAEGVDAGIVFAAAAGNGRRGVSVAALADYLPARDADVITVSALADYDGEGGGAADPLINGGEELCETTHPTFNYGEDDGLAWYSNNGKAVDMSAPGTCIYSTYPPNSVYGEIYGEYGYNSGTSMATPHVAGAAALLASEANPGDREDVESLRGQLESEGSQHWSDRYLYADGELVSGDGFYSWEWLNDGVQEPLLDVGPQEAEVHTTRALDLEPDAALLTGSVNPDGVSTTYQFEYGTTESYGSKVPASAEDAGAGSVDLKAAATAAELDPDTTYHFRLAATAGGETTYGADRAFTTPPSVITGEATGLGSRSARLEGRVDPMGSETEYWFEYGKTASYGAKVPVSPASAGSGSDYVKVSQWLGDLGVGVLYHYRLVASTDEEETFYGEDRTVTTTTSAFVAEPEPKYINGEPTVSRLHLATHQFPNGGEIYCEPPGALYGTNEEETADAIAVDMLSTPCTVYGAVKESTELEMNGCDFEFHPGLGTVFGGGYASYKGTYDIVCPAGNEIVLPSEKLCEITIPSQNGLDASYATKPSGVVEVSLTDFGVTYTQQAAMTGMCDNGTWSDGELYGSWEMSSEDIDNEPIPLEIEEQLADAAHAPRFESEAYSATLNGSGSGGLTTAGGVLECGGLSLSGSLVEAGSQMSLEAEYGEGCVLSGAGYPTDVHMNGCEYTLEAENAGPPYTGGLGISCPAEAAIEYRVFAGEAKKFEVCKVKAGTQSDLSGLDLSNVGEGDERAIEITGQVEGVSWSSSGLCGTESGEDGTIDLDVTLAAEDEGSGDLGVYLTGQELVGVFVDDEEAEQPEFKSESHPATLIGTGSGDLTTSSGTLECSDLSLRGPFAETTTEVTLDAEYDGGCALSGGANPTDVHMRSCEYTLAAGGDFGISCSKEDALEYRIYAGAGKKTEVCNVKVGPQSGLEGLELSTVGEGDERAIGIAGQVEGVSWSQSGLCGAESGEGGVLDLELALSGIK